jgi:hypothetical protein
MNLHDFTSHIDEKILERGYDYYEEDCVLSMEETEDNTYAAEVLGGDLYSVEVELDDRENIISSRCDCPYADGRYCKHQVAVFFALRDGVNTANAEIAPKAVKASDMREILAGRTKDELVEFLLELAAEYREIKQRIALNFNDESDGDEIQKSVMLIRTYIKNHSDRYGYVTYRETREAIKGADLVLEKAEFALEANKHGHALNLAFCVIREMLNLFENADDSDGEISGEIEEALTLIHEIVEDPDLIDRENIFQMLLDEAAHGRYADWDDWRLELLDTCSDLADTQALRDSLENRLETFLRNEEDDSWGAGYLAGRINRIRYNMIERCDGREKAREFMEENLKYYEFRKMAIENAFRDRDYDAVIRLAIEGEAQDKDYPGLIRQWKEHRYKAFRLSGRLEDLRGLALEFILDGSFEHYEELKSTHDAGEWLSVYPGIVVLLENQKNSRHDIYPRILIEEGEKQKLLDYVKAEPSRIEHFYKHLVPEFAEEVYSLFLQYIDRTAARASNRRAYRGVCDIIRNLKKAGGTEQAAEIKQALFVRYAKRPAFRDELSRV